MVLLFSDVVIGYPPKHSISRAITRISYPLTIRQSPIYNRQILLSNLVYQRGVIQLLIGIFGADKTPITDFIHIISKYNFPNKSYFIFSLLPQLTSLSAIKIALRGSICVLMIEMNKMVIQVFLLALNFV
jgi:hypothetical protein